MIVIKKTIVVRKSSYDKKNFCSAKFRALRGVLYKIRGRPRYLTDLAEILHVVLLWGPNYEIDVLKNLESLKSSVKFYFGSSEHGRFRSAPNGRQHV